MSIQQQQTWSFEEAMKQEDLEEDQNMWDTIAGDIYHALASLMRKERRQHEKLAAETHSVSRIVYKHLLLKIACIQQQEKYLESLLVPQYMDWNDFLELEKEGAYNYRYQRFII